MSPRSSDILVPTARGEGSLRTSPRSSYRAGAFLLFPFSPAPIPIVWGRRKKGASPRPMLRNAASMLGHRDQRNFRELRTGEVRRIHLLGTWVNKGKKEGSRPTAPCPFPLHASLHL
jgi:hypothetical protein